MEIFNPDFVFKLQSRELIVERNLIQVLFWWCSKSRQISNVTQIIIFTHKCHVIDEQPELERIFENILQYFAAHASPTSKNPQDLNPEVDKPGKRKKLDATARAGSEDKDAGKAFSLSEDFLELSWQRCRNGRDRTLCWGDNPKQTSQNYGEKSDR